MTVSSPGPTHTVADPDVAARREWMGIFARADTDELATAWDRVADKPDYRMLRRPEVGLAMVRARAGGTGARFNLGEMSMTRCAVETADGRIGLSYRAGRNVRAAEIAAVLDALLQDPSRRAALIDSVVAPLRASQSAARQARAAKVAATKVDFFTMVRGD